MLCATRSGGLLDWPRGVLEDTSEGGLEWSSEWGVTVTLASAGYPGPPTPSTPDGVPIAGLERVPEDVAVTHAGNALAAGGTIVTTGGRVLNVEAFQRDWKGARESAYAAARMISFEGMQLRGDIAAGIDDEERAGESERTIDSWLNEWEEQWSRDEHG
jgi:phosphoribosylamine--glycine ligase